MAENGEIIVEPLVPFVENYVNGLKRALVRITKVVERAEIPYEWWEEDSILESIGEFNDLVYLFNEGKVSLNFSKILLKPVSSVHTYYSAEQIREMFSNKNIARHLKQAGVEMSEEDIAEVFTRSRRLHFAVGNISDPLKGCLKYIQGKQAVRGHYYNG